MPFQVDCNACEIAVPWFTSCQYHCDACDSGPTCSQHTTYTYYVEHGHTPLDRQRIETSRELEDASRELEDATHQVEEQQTDIDDCNARNEDLAARVAALEDELLEKNEVISTMAQQLAARDHRISSLLQQAQGRQEAAEAQKKR